MVVLVWDVVGDLFADAFVLFGFAVCTGAINMMSKKRFDLSCVPAKVGTQPMVVRLDRRCRIAIGSRVRFKEYIGQRVWSTGIVTHVEPLRIDRI